jgi:hypothetical protein
MVRVDDGVDRIARFEAQLIGSPAGDARQDLGVADGDMDNHTRPRAGNDTGDFPHEDVLRGKSFRLRLCEDHFMSHDPHAHPRARRAVDGWQERRTRGGVEPG